MIPHRHIQKCGHVPANPDLDITICWKCGKDIVHVPRVGLYCEYRPIKRRVQPGYSRLNVNINEATHVRTSNGVERIIATWGIDAEGHLEPPSRGGFGVITETKQVVSMWDAKAYYATTD